MCCRDNRLFPFQRLHIKFCVNIIECLNLHKVIMNCFTSKAFWVIDQFYILMMCEVSKALQLERC